MAFDAMVEDSEGIGIASLAVIQTPLSSRLLRNSFCPDKDLFVVFSATSGKDRMSLWKLQGSKKWEVDLGLGLSVEESVINMAWSPDCQTIALMHEPPRLTFHSVQNGQLERQILFNDASNLPSGLLDIWWFAEEKRPSARAIPDIFKRLGVETGTALSILKMLPLLDNIADTVQTTGMPDAFGFRTMQPKPAADKPPASFTSWPSLPPDPLTASIEPPKRMQGIRDEDLDERDDVNTNSMLVVTDTSCLIYCFLDEKTPCSAGLTIFEIQKNQDGPLTPLQPAQVNLDLLSSRLSRDVAKLSSAAHQLCLYAYRVADDLKTVWMGSDAQPGARYPGLKWLTKLGDLQPENHESQSLEWAKIDLLQLLITERSTEPVTDFIGAGEQMTDRGLTKWENNVTSALIKLRDQPEQRIAPACQRLHLVLEEVLGMSKLPHFYSPFQFDTEEIDDCLNMISQIITAASWLASVARRELARFKEFMKWLRFEINNTSAQDSQVLQPRHDFLEVTSYICHGLLDSPIDKWFTDAPPTTLSPMPPTQEDDLEEVIRLARGALSDPNEIKLNRRVRPYSLDREGRNMHVLLLELAERCSALFKRAASGTMRSALGPIFPAVNMPAGVPGLIIHERTIVGTEKGVFTQLLAAYAPTDGPTCLCLFRLEHQNQAAPLLRLAVLECQKDGDVVDLADFEFFDDDTIVIIYRHRGQDWTYMGLVDFAGVENHFIPYQEPLQNMSREELSWRTTQRWRSRELVGVAMPLARWRPLTAWRGREKFNLAVNGRKGRRAAVVLVSDTMETLDLAADEDDDEDGGEDGEDD